MEDQGSNCSDSQQSSFQTPARRVTQLKGYGKRARGSNGGHQTPEYATPMLSQHLPFHMPESTLHLPRFRPYLGNPNIPLDVRADEFLWSRHFEVICAQALQLAHTIPASPPPFPFVSFEATPMHQWYEAVIMEFTSFFLKRLNSTGTYPRRLVFRLDGSVAIQEDRDAYNREVVAHINTILYSFNISTLIRPLGSLDNLFVDLRQPHAHQAAMALRDATELAEHPPKNQWKAGEPLHQEYRRRVGMFRIGVVRLIEDGEDAWILEAPGNLDRGVDAYAEYYIAHLRRNIIEARAGDEPLWLSSGKVDAAFRRAHPGLHNSEVWVMHDGAIRFYSQAGSANDALQ